MFELVTYLYSTIIQLIYLLWLCEEALHRCRLTDVSEGVDDVELQQTCSWIRDVFFGSEKVWLLMEVMVFELIYDNKRMYFYRRCPSCLRLCRRKDVAAHGGESSLVSAAAFVISE